MSTDSVTAQLKAIANRIRAYTGHAGVTLGSLNVTVYLRRPADDAKFPHLVLRKINAVTDPSTGNASETFDVEATVYGRGRSSEETVDAIADLVELALITWVDSSAAAGLTFGRYARRDPLPYGSPPANSEIVGVRLLVECEAWPAYLTEVLNT